MMQSSRAEGRSVEVQEDRRTLGRLKERLKERGFKKYVGKEALRCG